MRRISLCRWQSAKLNRVVFCISMRRLRDELPVNLQLFPNTRYLLLGLLLRRLLYAKREEGTRRHETKGENVVVPRRDPSGPVNLHLARRQMSAQPELSLYASRYTPLLLPSPFRSLDSARRLLSFFIQIPSRGIIKRPSPYSAKENHIGPSIFRASRGDSKLMQREVSGDFDNWRYDERRKREKKRETIVPSTLLSIVIDCSLIIS